MGKDKYGRIFEIFLKDAQLDRFTSDYAVKLQQLKMTNFLIRNIDQINIIMENIELDVFTSFNCMKNSIFKSENKFVL